MIRKILVTELVIIALLGLYFFPLSSLGGMGIVVHKIIRGLLLFFILLHIPGYWRSRVFFKENELTVFERFITSFALSLGFTVFVSLYLSLAGVAVNTRHGITVSCVAIALGIIIVVVQQRRK